MYFMNHKLFRKGSLRSSNVHAINAGDKVIGDVIVGWYGEDTTAANQHEYIVAENKTTTDTDRRILCIVQGEYNISGLTTASNTTNNIAALANRGIYGITKGE